MDAADRLARKNWKVGYEDCSADFIRKYLYGNGVPTSNELLNAFDTTSCFYCALYIVLRHRVYVFTLRHCKYAKDLISFRVNYATGFVEVARHGRRKCPWLNYAIVNGEVAR
jgi:hypothetical protein